MRHLFKLVVGTLSLAVMLVGFVPSLARAQMAIVERIDVPNNCAKLYGGDTRLLGDGVITTFSAEKTGPLERAEGTVTVAFANGGDVRLKIAAVNLNYQWRATFEKGQGADVKGPYVLAMMEKSSRTRARRPTNLR